MMDFIAVLVIAFLIGMASFFVGRHVGYEEYFKGQIECKQAFEIIECKKVKND